MCTGAIAGDTCAAPFTVDAVPFSFSGDTNGFANDYSTLAACTTDADRGDLERDVVFVFTPTETGTYQWTKPTSGGPAILYATTDCADIANSCLGDSGDIYGGGSTWSIALTAGTTVYFILDGWLGGLDGSDKGPFTLELELLPSESPTCAAYCDAVQSACTDGNAQYASAADCLAYCETWGQLPAGDVSDTSGNTIGCRTYHAGVAATTDAALHCPHAGPSGGGVCGTWCDNYCHLSQTNCTGGNELYADLATCETACGGLSDTGEPGAVDGDSTQCRIYHLGVAGSDGETSAATHCPHGATDGGGVCVDIATATGNTCADAIPIGALPFTGAGDTADKSNDYSFASGDCPGEGGGYGGANNDQAWSFTPASDGTFKFSFSGSSFDGTIYLVTDCGDIANTCLAADDNISETGTETLQLDLTGGTTYFLIVDGWSNADSTLNGTYTLEVEEITLGAPGELLINEVDYDQPGSDTGEFVEIYNYGTVPADLNNWTLEHVNGASGNPLVWTAQLGDAAATLPPGGYLVVGDSGVIGSLPPGVLGLALPGSVQNGAPDGLRLMLNGTKFDGISYEGTIADVGEGGSAGTDAGVESLSRCPNASDTGDNAVDFEETDTPTPGAENDCAAASSVTFADVQPIYAQKCGPCHTVLPLGGHQMGAASSSTGYTSSQQASYSLPGGTKGAASLLRIQNGSMPQGGGCTGEPALDSALPNCLTQAEQDLIQSWLDGGQLAPPP